MSNKKINKPRINDEIKGYDVARVVFNKFSNEKSEEDFNEIMPLSKAFEIAKKKELDVIEINSKSSPAIVKIANYSKYMYELKKKLKNKPKPSELKEIQLSTNISEHDLAIKANKAKNFIQNGDKVKAVLTMRGRELSRRDESKKSLLEFIVMLEDVALPESNIRDENNKSMIILKKK